MVRSDDGTRNIWLMWVRWLSALAAVLYVLTLSILIAADTPGESLTALRAQARQK